jgi:hypothetical protein
MFAPDTLLQLTHKLVAFANQKDAPFFTGEPPTVEYLKRVRHRCELLSAWQPSKVTHAPPALVNAAKQWLKEWRDQASVPAYPYVSLDMAFSLTSDADVELIVARFPSLNAQLALTFSDLLKPGRPLIRQCRTERCGVFFVIEPGARGQPRKHCDTHYEMMKLTKKKPTLQGGKDK